MTDIVEVLSYAEGILDTAAQLDLPYAGLAKAAVSLSKSFASGEISEGEFKARWEAMQAEGREKSDALEEALNNADGG